MPESPLLPNDADRDDDRTLADLRRLGAVPPPRAEFARILKENLMQTTPSAMPTAVADDRRQAPHRWHERLLPDRLPGWGAVATVVLLGVTLLGAYAVAGLPAGPLEPPRNPLVPAAFQTEATPTVEVVAAEAIPTESPDGVLVSASPPAAVACGPDIYFGCPQLAKLVGGNHLPRATASELPTDIQQVQLQGWAISPGVSLTGTDPDAMGPDTAQGIVVDFVLDGAYVATFDGPVVVHPGAFTNEPIQYLEPGTVVELGRGDAVSYALGGLRELRNPLQEQRIEFKRAIIFDGGRVPSVAVSGEGVSSRVEAEGVLPQPLAAYDADVSFGLWYVHVREGAYPPLAWQDEATFLLGPVDPQWGPVGTEGFVLVVREALG